MSIFLNGIDAKYITMNAEYGLTEGAACTISDNCTVRDADTGEIMLGVTHKVQGDFASVQIAGYVKLPYSGTITAPGFHALVGDGVGGVKLATTGGREHLVVEVDSDEKIVGLFL